VASKNRKSLARPFAWPRYFTHALLLFAASPHAGAVTLNGTSAADTFDVSSQTGPYEIYALGGNDLVYGSPSADLVEGASGADRLFGNGGNDTLSGGPGNDTLDGGADHDAFLYAGTNTGIDEVAGGPGIDVIRGSAGNDIFGLKSINSVEFIDGAGGYDVIQLSNGGTLDLSGAILTGIGLIAGSPKADKITASDGDDVIEGRGGNDLIYGRAGRDVAVYSDESVNYVVTSNGGQTTVRHNHPTDGTDTLVDVEVLSFVDGRIEAGVFYPRYPENNVPIARPDSATVQEDGSVEIEILGNDDDPDGEAISIRSLSTPANGTVSKTAFGTALYTPRANYAGPDNFTYEVADPRYGRATGTVSIDVLPMPDAPVAVADRADVVSGRSTTIDVLANDKDADGEALNVESVTTPSQGSVAIEANQVRYSSPSGFSGTVTLSYEVADPTGRSSSATVTVVVASSTLSGELHSTLSAAPERSWVRVNKNLFSEVWPVTSQRPSVGATNPARVISAWSSMAWDPNRGDLIFWGGGHKNYSGNEVYRFRTSTLRWERASLPSDIVNPLGDQQWFAIDGPMNAPISSHTYDNQEFLPISDRFLTFGGAKFNAKQSLVLEDGVTRTGPYLWNPNRANPDSVGGTTGSHVNKALFPSVLGGQMWQNRDSLVRRGTGTYRPASFINSTSAYAPIHGKDSILVSETPRTNAMLYRFTVNDVNNPDFDTWEVVGSLGEGYSDQGAGAHDPVRGIYLRTGNSAAGPVFIAWNTKTPGLGNKSINFKVTDPSGQFQLSRYHGMDFDQRRGAFVLWDGDPGVWYLTPPNTFSRSGWSISRGDAPTSAPVPYRTSGRLITGTSIVEPWGILGKWKYANELDVFFGVEDPIRGDIWIYKPENWTPSE